MKIDINSARYFAEIGGFKNDNIDIGKEVTKLRTLCNKHHRICEMVCNGRGYYLGINFETVDYDDINNPIILLTDKIESKIAEIVKLINPDFSVYFQYDPRGYTTKIQAENGRLNISYLLLD